MIKLIILYLYPKSSGVTATFTFKNGCEEIVIPADAKDSNNYLPL